MKISVNESCIACHRCYVFYPELFVSDANGWAYPRFTEVNGECEEMAMDAVETCPVGAIDCKNQEGMGG